MDAMKIRAALRALDELEDMLDDRDASDAKRLKESGVQPNKGSDANDDEGGGMGNKSPSEDPSHEATQDDDSGNEAKEPSDKGAPENSGDDFHEQLRKMSKTDSNAKNALKFLSEDRDDEDDDEY